MGQELTPWFVGSVKPVRPGVYQRNYHAPGKGTWYAEWTGNQWLSPARTPLTASKQVAAAFTQDVIPWRGLAQDPKGKSK